MYASISTEKQGYVSSMIVLTMDGSLSTEMSTGYSHNIAADPQYCEKTGKLIKKFIHD